MKINKAKANYWIDLVIGIGFIVAAASGLVLLFAHSSGGYQGGRNPNYLRPILFLSRDTWKTLHSWSAITMVIGVTLHFLLHWRWITCMTGNLFKRKKAARGTPAVHQSEVYTTKS